MQKRQFLQSALVASIAVYGLPTRAQTVDAAAVVRHYSAQVYATYQDALASAIDMQTAIRALVAAPSPQSLAAARKTWLAAREWYLQTEAFRFYGGPIDDDKGPEGRINSWPMDESYLDYVVGKPNAGVINDRRVAISTANIIKLNERGGEENISTGWHAIEFLLWGQDLSATGPGDRSFEDYVVGKAANADRRRAYLTTVTGLLVADLNYLVKAWQPGAKNYRAKFEQGDLESVRKMIMGLGSLSRGELAGERLEVAMNTQDQEDEHSCFSDNTHRDVVGDAQGIENVWLGSYKRPDGNVLQGASLKALVASKNASLADKVSQQIAQSVANASAIQAPFDREIVGNKDAPGRIRIQKTIDSLVQQSKDLTEAAAVLGITKLAQAK
ncbi:MAG: iron-regulated protein [Candidatus Saccharibacteria bacterium]|nr:iron-regulated protein [Rhodoferax sp.]